jgi:glycosyltransferase
MKKRELYLFNSESRAAVYGIGTYMEQLLKVLKGLEWKFSVVYMGMQGNEARIIERDGYCQIDIPRPPSHHQNAELYYSETVTCLLKDMIATDRMTEYIFHLNFMGNVSLVSHLKRSFKRCKIVLVAHYTDWSFALLGDFKRLRKIIDGQCKETMTEKEKTVAKIFKEEEKMFNRVDRLVCVANHTLKVYRTLGQIRTDHVEVIYNALKDVYVPLSDEERCALRRKYRIADTVPIILFAGRLDDVKGLSCLIRSFKQVLATHPAARLIIAGDGNFGQYLSEAADCWMTITFTGRLNKAKLYDFYRMADLGVICSLHEEFGLVAIEMMMHALPVIVTRTGGLDEIVEDGISGLKIPVRTVKGRRQVDTGQLAEKIAFLLDHPIVAGEMGTNGRKRFLKKFELSVFARKMLNLYNNMF